ncbi:MAG: dodecin domain-containing protein [Sphingobacteriales bacterium]|nr:MAG: dodecin domain-containing protein [Sphingobacteriales bacterium]
MAVLKVIEILSNSTKGWEDAAQNAVTEASKTLRNIESIYIKNMEAKVDANLIVEYRINAKITFRID